MLYGWVEDSGSTELLLRLKYLKAMYLSTYYPSLPLHPLLSLHSETSSRFLLLRLSLYFTNVHLPPSFPVFSLIFQVADGRRHEQYLKNTATGPYPSLGVQGTEGMDLQSCTIFDSLPFLPRKKKFEEVRIEGGMFGNRNFYLRIYASRLLMNIRDDFSRMNGISNFPPRFVMFTVASMSWCRRIIGVSMDY